MGIRIDGNADVINAADGTLTVEGISVNITGISTASGGYKVGSAYTVFSNGNVATAGIITSTKLQVNSATNTAAEFRGSGGAGFIAIKDGDDGTQAFIGVDAGLLKFQTSGSSYSDKLTITTGGDINVASAATIKANGNATFSGIVTAASFVGDGSGLTGAGPSLTGSTNNTIVTVTGANAIQGESNLKFDGTDLFMPNELRDINQSDCLMGFDNSIIKFKTAGVERLRIPSGGGVGINTDKIRSSRNVSIAGVTRDYTNSGTDLVDAGGIILQPTIHLPSTGQAYPGIWWSGNTAALGRARAGITGVAASNNDATDLVFFAKLNAGGAGMTPADEKMRLTNGGRIGIASDVPSVPLDVIGDVHLGSKKFIFNQSTAHFGIFDSSTDTSPDNEIQVVTAAPQLRLEENSSGASKRLDLFVTSGGQPTIAANQSSQSIAFQTTGSERFRITNDGVTFNGDTAAANGLADYEEGTWTPTVHDGTISTGVCKYTKVGRLVTIVAKVLNFSNNSANDSVRIQSLPFTPSVVDCMAGTLMGSYLGQTNSSAVYLADTNQLIAYGQHSGAFDNLRHNELSISGGSTVLYIVATYMAS